MRIKKVIYSLLFLSIVFVSCSKSKPVQTSIDNIYIYHSMEGSKFEEYKIDFKNKEFTILVRNGFINMVNEVKRDSPIVKPLDMDSIDDFLSTAQESGFENWEKSYNNYNVDDGHQWGITISFSDGTEKEIKGSNAYPETWNEMYVAFETLTGENILHWQSDRFNI